MIIDGLTKSLPLTQQRKFAENLGLEKEIWAVDTLRRWSKKSDLKEKVIYYVLIFSYFVSKIHWEGVSKFFHVFVLTLSCM